MLTLIGLHVPGNYRAEANVVLNTGDYAPAGLTPVTTEFAVVPAAIGLIGRTAVFTLPPRNQSAGPARSRS